MKTLEEIYQGIQKNEEDYRLKCYISEFEQEIGGDMTKLLLYRYECGQKTDAFGESSIWLPVAAIMITLLSIATNTVGEKGGILIYVILVAVIVMVLIMLAYYKKIVNRKRKYQSMSMALEEVARKLMK